MRKDITKVLVTRPRVGARYKYPKGEKRRLQRLGEDLPKTESMTKKWRRGWGGKELNEYLSPLLRFLKKNIGHKWDDVYSEIRANLNLKSTMSYHVMQHLYWYVELHPERKPNGKINTKRIWAPMYVNDDGILTKTPKGKRKRWKRKPPEPRTDRVEIKGVVYTIVGASWYECKEVPVVRWYRSEEGTLEFRKTNIVEQVPHRMLSKKEIKKLKLNE